MVSDFLRIISASCVSVSTCLRVLWECAYFRHVYYLLNANSRAGTLTICAGTFRCELVLWILVLDNKYFNVAISTCQLSMLSYVFISFMLLISLTFNNLSSFWISCKHSPIVSLWFLSGFQYCYHHIFFAEQARFLCFPGCCCEIIALLLPLTFLSYVSSEFLFT